MDLVSLSAYHQDDLRIAVMLRREDVESESTPETCFIEISNCATRKLFPIKDPSDCKIVQKGPEIVLNRYLPMCLASIQLSR